MRVASIRDLKHDTTTVLGWVASGEPVEIQRRGQPVAILTQPASKAPVPRPDFKARLKSIYGEMVLGTTATELLEEERSNR
jgi:antitoxin (DNA-binding transcriptional repressor) of toxin-antitoxin stability system